MLIDSHCHLDFPDFAGRLDDVIARAEQNGDSARALTVYRRMVEVAPSNGQGWWALARLQLAARKLPATTKAAARRPSLDEHPAIRVGQRGGDNDHHARFILGNLSLTLIRLPRTLP